MFLEVSELQVRYKGQSQSAVDGVTFGLRTGDIGVLIGPSGCGKTTLLRAVAGLEPVSAGNIKLSGNVVSSASVQLAPEARRIGMVFQDYALFPHLDVRHNVGFGIHHCPSLSGARALQKSWNWWACPPATGDTRMCYLAASNNALHWPAPWRPNRNCCCWTSPSPTST